MLAEDKNKVKTQKAMEQVIQHGTKTSMCQNGMWGDISLAQFPHTHKIGERKDENYDIEFYAVPDDVYVSAYDEKTSSVVKAKVQSWSVHRGKEVEIVTLNNGKQLLTDNDPRAVYGIARDAATLEPQRFTPSEALEKKVFVPVVQNNGAPRFYEDTETGTLEEWRAEVNSDVTRDATHKYEALAMCYYNFNTGEIIDQQELLDADSKHVITKLDFAFGQFLGCLAGDGWWDKKDYDSLYTKGWARRAIHIADLSEHNATFIHSWLTDLLGPVEYRKQKRYAAFDKSRYGDTITHTFFSSKTHIIAEALDHLLDGHRDANTSGSRNKVLPAWASYTPEEFRYGLICGLISTDGTISIHTHTDGRRQLLVSMTSTSLTLMKCVSSILTSVGIPSRIGVSKETIAGNISWMLTISTPEFKKAEGSMLGMAHKDKLATLLQSTVSIDNKYQRNITRIVFPTCVSQVVIKNVPCVKVTKQMRQRRNEQDLEKIAQNNFSIMLYSGAKEGYVTLKTAVNVYEYAYSQLIDAISACTRLKKAISDTGAMDKEAREDVEYNKEINEELKSLLDTMLPLHYREEHEKDTVEQLKRTLNRYANKGKAKAEALHSLYSFCVYVHNHVQQGGDRVFALYTEPMFVEWMKLVTGGFDWSAVASVEKTGKVETGYDLTVPGYETFMNSEGVILSNTINVHVPASDDAVKEAYEKLMPSKTPFSDRIPGKIVPLPKQEQILGLYTAATAPKTKPIIFNSEEEALAAIRKGEIPLSVDIEIAGQRKSAAKKEEDKKEKLLSEIGPIRNPKNGQFMPTDRDKSVPMAKEASEKVISFTLTNIKQGQQYKIKTSRLHAFIPMSAKAAVEEAKEAFDKGNIKPAMKLIRKYSTGYPADLYILSADKLLIKKTNK